jgi:hypothetical protein
LVVVVVVGVVWALGAAGGGCGWWWLAGWWLVVADEWLSGWWGWWLVVGVGVGVGDGRQWTISTMDNGGWWARDGRWAMGDVDGRRVLPAARARLASRVSVSDLVLNTRPGT